MFGDIYFYVYLPIIRTTDNSKLKPSSFDIEFSILFCKWKICISFDLNYMYF